ncbi:hypothetical protein CYMTET_25384 [Cymbomonas tetramitiformis]|uniref:Uncharacterized protein n=1 Tax=Cymbomonas tetramitiformis TaxID=36881 RepID=A0AAE0KZ08_9CHLO|nr:hypothetical protein CYMTET_25384 [Cymbomonas tetramitiformis]
MDVEAGFKKTALSMTLDQFLWSPIFFATYLIPMNAALNGKAPSEALQDVKSELIPTLIASAKVWTPANAIIYNVPLTWRVLAANGFDLVWAIYLSIFVTDDDQANQESSTAEAIE